MAVTPSVTRTVALRGEPVRTPASPKTVDGAEGAELYRGAARAFVHNLHCPADQDVQSVSAISLTDDRLSGRELGERSSRLSTDTI